MSKSKKFKLKYFHLCDFASISADGKTNLLGIFEKIIVTKLPSKLAHLYMVFNLESSSNNKEPFHISITDSENKELFLEKIKGDVIIPKGKEKANINGVVQINNFPINSTGKYSIELTCSDELIAREVLVVEEVNKENE